MVTDQEPRYRLVDANGNIVGTLFAESDGTLKLQEGTSGNENELELSTDGETTVESLTSGSVFSDAITVFVRSGGDDSNKGLSTANPKATIQAALDDAPAATAPNQPLVIDLGSGSYGPIDTDGRSVSHLKLTSTDGATLTGDPAATISQCYCEFDGVSVEANAPTLSAVLVTNGAILRTNGEDIVNTGGGYGVWIRNGGFGFLQNAKIEGDGGVTCIAGRANVQNCTVNSTSNESAFRSWDGATFFSIDNTITNLTGGGGFAVYTRKNGSMKSQGDEFVDWAVVFDTGIEGSVQINQSITLNGSDRLRNRGGGIVRDESVSPPEEFAGLPRRDSDPNVSNVRNPGGLQYYNTTNDEVRVYETGTGWVAK